MARLARLTLPSYPHHVIQRGNNQQAVFTEVAHFQFFLNLLKEESSKHDVAVHAYVLMPNHFHLLATPQSDNLGMPRMMQAIGRSYVRYFNDCEHRSGTLWEGRYRSTVIDAKAYLLSCQIYLDLNPVRAGLAATAMDYPWSSCAHYMGLRANRLISSHAEVWALGNTPFAREAAYSEKVRSGVSEDLQQLFTQSALTGWALGEPAFLAELQEKTPRRLTPALAGRPAKPRV